MRRLVFFTAAAALAAALAQEKAEDAKESPSARLARLAGTKPGGWGRADFAAVVAGLVSKRDEERATAEALAAGCVSAGTLEKLLDVLRKPAVRELVENGSFERGLSAWRKRSRMKRGRVKTLEVVRCGDGSALKYERENAGADGGCVLVEQDLKVSVRGLKRLILTLRGRVLSHDLNDSGWCSTRKGGTGEYPLHVSLDYLDAGERKVSWKWGCLTRKNSEPLENYWLVRRGEWAMMRLDLLDDRARLEPNRNRRAGGRNLPAMEILRVVRVGGNGWDFSGEVDFVSLLAVRDEEGFRWLVGRVVKEKEGPGRRLMEAAVTRLVGSVDFAAWRRTAAVLGRLESEDSKEREAARAEMRTLAPRAWRLLDAFVLSRGKDIPPETRARVFRLFVPPVPLAAEADR